MYGPPACKQGSETPIYIHNKDWPPVVNYKRGSHTKRQAGKEALQGQPTVVRIKHQLMIFRRSRLKLLYSLLKTNNTNIRKLQKAGCAVLNWSNIWAVLGPVGLQFPAGQGCRPHMQPRTARRAEPTDCVGTSHSRQYSWQSSSTCMDHLCVFKGWPIWSFQPIIKWKHVHPPPVVLYKGRKKTAY